MPKAPAETRPEWPALPFALPKPGPARRERAERLGDGHRATGRGQQRPGFRTGFVARPRGEEDVPGHGTDLLATCPHRAGQPSIATATRV